MAELDPNAQRLLAVLERAGLDELALAARTFAIRNAGDRRPLQGSGPVRRRSEVDAVADYVNRAVLFEISLGESSRELLRSLGATGPVLLRTFVVDRVDVVSQEGRTLFADVTSEGRQRALEAFHAAFATAAEALAVETAEVRRGEDDAEI